LQLQTDKIHKILLTADEETRRAALHALRGGTLAVIRPLLFAGMGDISWRVRKEAVDIFVAAASDRDDIAALLELFRSEENAGLRNSAAEAVIRLGELASVPLCQLAGDADADVRKFVVDVMGAIGSRSFVPVLLKMLEDRDENVAAAAAEQLGNAADTSVVPQLLSSIVANPSLTFRFSAFAALSRLDAVAEVPPEILAMSEQDILRQSVYGCLGGIGNSNVSAILLKGFAARQKNCRKAAVLSWFRLYSKSNEEQRLTLVDELKNMPADDIVPAIIETFDSDDAQISEAVVVLLGILRDVRAVPVLLRGCSSERISLIALKGLIGLGSAGARLLAGLFDSVDDKSRCAICLVIGELRYADGRPVILRALGCLSPLVRIAALKAVAQLGMHDALAEVIRMLGDVDDEVRNSVVDCLAALAAIDSNEIMAVAERLAGSANPEHRREAALLAPCLDKYAYLGKLMKDEEQGVRQAATISLGKIRNAGGVGMLQIALVDESTDVRIAAAEALGEIGGDEAMEALLAAFSDEDVWVKCAVLSAIGRISVERLFSAICSIFNDAEGLLLINCLQMLGRIGTSQAIELVRSRLHDRDRDVSALASSIVERESARQGASN